MKRFPALLIIALWLTACANLETNSYRTIGAIAVSVDGSMQAYGSLVREGKVSDAEQATVKAMFLKYQAAAKVAQVSISAYRLNPDATQLNRAIAVASAAGSDLTQFIFTFVPKGNP